MEVSGYGGAIKQEKLYKVMNSGFGIFRFLISLLLLSACSGNEKKQGEAANPGISAKLPAQPAGETQVQNEIYLVKQGESCFSISKKFGMKVERLLELNGKTQASLHVGEQLRVERKQ